MFAAAPTPPPPPPPPPTTASAVATNTASSTLTSTARPSRLRGLSYLRNFNHHSDNSSSPSRHILSRSISHQTDANGHTTRSPPAAPSTFLSQSVGYLSSIGASSSSSTTNNSNNHLPPQTTAAQSAISSREDTESHVNAEDLAAAAAAEMVRRKRVGSSQAGQEPPQLRGGSSSVATTAAAAANGLANGNGRGPNSPEARDLGSSEPTGNLQGLTAEQAPTVRFIPHQDPRSTKPSLDFTETSRTLPHEDCVIRVGRYSERDANVTPAPNTPSSAPVGFKSKVVSRKHCEFWCSQGQWYIKDVKSSSGTFLNHIRLSQPSVESRPFPVNDGDIVQLGIDFRGGEEQIFRCVKIRIECNRAWQKSLNNFNMSTHKRLRALGAVTSKEDDGTAHAAATECSICLMSVAPCQSLFVAPCSHVWHFKCIRPILNDHKTYPHFPCPNCRAVANLEAEVDEPVMADWEELPDDSSNSDSDSKRADETQLDEVSGMSAQAGGSIHQEVDDAIVSINQELHIYNADAVTANGAGPSSATTAGISSRPIDIPMPPNQTMDLAQGRLDATSPSRVLNGEGPLTPRNDAGPFVFDGSAGRASGRPLAESLNAAGS